MIESQAPTDVEWGTTLVLALLQLRYHDHSHAWSALVEERRAATQASLMRAGMEAVCELQLEREDAVLDATLQLITNV